MSLGASLSIAAGEIINIGSQLALVSQNVANASTPNYAVETISQESIVSGGIGDGAVNGVATRAINQQAQAEVFGQNGAVAGLQTQQQALQQIDAVQGTVGSGNDIASLLGKLQDAFSTLQGSPANGAQQVTVVDAAQTLAAQINAVSQSVGAQRQAAQDAIVAGVASVNADLASLGTLSDQITAAQQAGESTANLQNQRDSVESSLSQLIGVTFQQQPNGDLQVFTQGGLNLPIHGVTNPLTTGAAILAPGSSEADGTIPPILFNGKDVTSQLAGGTLGANITLRDQTLPTIQANLDEFSYTLASRFAAQGLTLFTDENGNVPAGGGTPVQSGYVGFANTIQVNPAVAATPSLVRDGTNAIAGSATGAAAFTPNPPGGPTGFTTLISNVLSYTFGTDAQSGVAQPAPNTTGLGVDGTLSAGFAAPPDLAGLATAVVAGEAQQSANVTTQLTNEQAVQTTLQAQLAAQSAVNVDAQVSQLIVLQNAYAANAHVITTVQAMFNDLLQAVQ